MGRSVICTFSVHVYNSTTEFIYGAMSLKQAKGVLFSDRQFCIDNNRPLPLGANVWAQTPRGERLLRGHDYIHLDEKGNITYKMIEHESRQYAITR